MVFGSELRLKLILAPVPSAWGISFSEPSLTQGTTIALGAHWDSEANGTHFQYLPAKVRAILIEAKNHARGVYPVGPG
jgi:hypothetical protein